MSLPAPAEPLPVRPIPPARIGAWLGAGFADLCATPLPSLAHGLAVALGGWGAIWLAHTLWWLAPGAVSGFVIVGPILCTGLYELSRLRGRGMRPGFGDVVHAWARESRPLVQMGLLLFVLATLWVAFSAALFALFVRTPIQDAQAFLRYAMVEQGNLMFTLWGLAGGLGCAVVFGLSAVAPPLLMGRQVGLRQALLTSIRAVGENPFTMGLWAAVVMGAVLVSLATAMLGFVVTIPLIGHATWHAYKDLVDSSAVPLRNE